MTAFSCLHGAVTLPLDAGSDPGPVLSATLALADALLGCACVAGVRAAHHASPT